MPPGLQGLHPSWATPTSRIPVAHGPRLAWSSLSTRPTDALRGPWLWGKLRAGSSFGLEGRLEGGGSEGGKGKPPVLENLKE